MVSVLSHMPAVSSTTLLLAENKKQKQVEHTEAEAIGDSSIVRAFLHTFIS